MAEITIEDYTPASIALFSEPKDYFKAYSQYLKQMGSFNPNLRGRPGWIFSKKREAELRNIVDLIKKGQILPLPVTTYGKQPAPMFEIVPETVPAGYQKITMIVPRPEIGKSLNLEIGGQDYPITVETVQEHDGIVDGAVVVLADGQRTRIELVKAWKIVGYDQLHSITIPK